MDWKYKHFNQRAVFNAPISSVIEAARSVVGESLSEIQDTADGFTARGYSAWHAATATFRAASGPDGTQLTVELLVQRAAGRGYMLVDIGSYYNSLIDKWFTGISQRLGTSGEQSLVSKTTSGARVQRGCVVGCLVWLAAAACIGGAGTILDRAVWSQSSGTLPGPFGSVASVIALLLGIAAFLYVVYPEGSVANFIRRLLQKPPRDAKQ